MQEDAAGELSPATLARVRDAYQSLVRKVDAIYPAGSRERLDSGGWLKALGGLVRMLHRPDVEALLAGVETYRGTTLGDLLGFMQAFNLRFGPATTPRQRAIYQTDLYPKLDRLRDEAVPAARADAPLAAAAILPEHRQAPGALFEKMDREHFDPARPIPPVPRFQPAPQP